MKTVVIYESHYGFTQYYAEQLAKALSCPLFQKNNFHPQDFEAYDVIIYGGGLYAGKVSGLKIIAKNWELLCHKKVILFTCGLADPTSPANVSHIRKTLSNALSPQMIESIKLFHLRGGIQYSKLSFVHKAMMFMLRRMLLKKDSHALGEEDRQILDTYGKEIDFTERSAILPIITYIETLQSKKST